MAEKIVPSSKFYMLRCLIAMAHADGVFHDDERAYIENMMNHLPLSDEQTAILKEDMEVPQNVEELHAKIEDPSYRGQLVYFARLMAHKDGVFDPSEEVLLDRLHKYSLDKVDMDAVKEQVREVVQADMIQHEITIDEGRPTRRGKNYAFLRWLDEGLQNIGIDIMQD